MGKHIVIIGGVANGAKTASRIKRLEPETEITILEKGETLSYGACGLPYYVSDVVEDLTELMTTPMGAIRDEAFFRDVKGVYAYTKMKAEKIDRKCKIVTAISEETGITTDYSYEKLVLAVGSSPVVPDIDGINLKDIYTMSTLNDGLELKNRLSANSIKKAVVVGAGLIGMEMVETFRLMGVEVSVVEALDWVLPTIIDKDIGLLVNNYLKGESVRLFTSDRVVRFEGDDAGHVKKVITENNEIEADIVLICIGVKPNVSLAEDAGLTIGDTGAIEVNEYLQTSDPDIYAGGDCVQNKHRITGKNVYAPLGSTANKHGRYIADHIAGVRNQFPGVLGTGICKILNYNIARTGLSEKEAVACEFDVETVICPGQDKPHFYPDARILITKLIADKKTGKLLGAQIIGPGDVAKRIDIAVSALSNGYCVSDIAALDLAYAPPFSPPMDNIITSANVMINKLQGIGRSISPLAVNVKLNGCGEPIILDVRSSKEFNQFRIDATNVMNIPLEELRKNHGRLPKDKEIVVICIGGLRAYEAKRILDGNGFSNVSYMEGGIIAWPFEIV